MTTYTNERYYEPQYQREPTLGDLFSDLSAQASLLVKQEIRLAKAEMSQKASRAGREVAMIAAGGVLAHAALLAAVYGSILSLGALMPLWLAAFIVGLVLAIGGGILIRSGVQALKKINPAPGQTINSLKEDKEWLTRQMMN
jgi:hypothetical protein